MKNVRFPDRFFSRYTKKIYTHADILTLAALLSLPAQATEPGQFAPEFDLPGLTHIVRLSDYKGKLVYLDFWASWCGPCKQSFPWMNEMQTRYGSKGLSIVGINVDQQSDDARAFLKEHAASFEIAFDQSGKTPRSYGIKGMPTSILIGADGKVLMVHSGFRDDQRNELESNIRHSLKIKD